MSLAKRLFVFGLVIATTVMTMGLGSFSLAAGNYGAGSLLALEGVSGAAVYYIGSDGMKYVFPDGKTYATWYSNFDDVVRVDVAELDMYPDGGAVTYRPGTKLVTHENTAKIYAVSPGGVLHWIPTGAVAEDLYGANWASMVMDVIPGYFSSSYSTGSDLSDMYPDGTLVQMGETIYYISEGNKRPFASGDAFEANNFSYDSVLDVSDLSAYPDGESITGEEMELSGYMPGEGNTNGNGNVSGGDLTVSLASGTPASGVVVSNAARVPFTKLALTTGAEGVTIDSMVVQRGGIGQDGAFSSVDVLDSNMLPYDPNSKSFNSDHQATFTKDIEIPANTTKYIYLAGNMGTIGATYAGEFPALGLASVTLKGSGNVLGSLPVYGNTQTLNGTITIGTATVQRGAYTNATSTTIEVGKTDYTFFSFQVTTQTEDGTFSQVTVYNEGTGTLGTDLVNLELLKDGSKLADGVVDGKYVKFSFNPLDLTKGQIYQFQVRGDVEDGSGRTIKLEIYRNTDLLVMGKTYGYNITPTYSGTGSGSAKPYLTDNQFTVSAGTMVIERGLTVGSENITIDTDQVIGSFKFTVKGEPIDVTEFVMTLSTGTPTTLKNVELVDPNGLVVGGPADPTTSHVVTLSDTFTVPTGESEYTVRGDLQSNAGWVTDATLYASVTPSTGATAEGTVTGDTITASPAAAVNTNTQTVKGAYLTVTRDTLPASTTVIAGAQDVLLGSWTFDATNSGEDIRVSTVAFAASSSNVTNLTVYNGEYGNGGVAMSPINDAPSSDDDGATSSFSFDDPIIITKGESITVQLVGDINTNATANDSAEFGLTDASTSNNPSVFAYGKNSGIRAYTALTADNGATLTFSSAGAVTVSTYNNPSNALARAGATGVTFGNVKIDALYEDLDLDELYVFVADGGLTGTATGNYQDVLKVYLYDGSTKLAEGTISVDGYRKFTFLNGTLTIPKDGSKTLTLKADLGTINQNTDDAPATPAADVKFGFGGTDGFKFTGNDSNTTATETYNGSTTSAMVLHKALPTVSYSESGNTLGAATSLTNGSPDIFAFKVSADSAGSEVLLYRATFELATTGVDVTSCYLKDSDGNTVGAAATPTYADGEAKAYLSYTFNNPDISAGDNEEALMIGAGSSETYKLNCAISGVASGDTMSVALVGDVASSTPAASFGTPAATGQNIANAWSAYDKGNFVWSDNFKNRGLATDGANATAYGQWYNGYLVSGLNGTSTLYILGSN